MSDTLYNEVPVPGKTEYKPGDWKSYAKHNDVEILGFFGDYRFLSNFEPCNIDYEGVIYPSVEHAYQASKVKSAHRANFLRCTAAESKKLWKNFPLLDASPKEWDRRKVDVMTHCLFQKFMKNHDLRDKLVATGYKYLQETNHWGDTFWGVDVKKGGKNVMGELLMAIRGFFHVYTSIQSNLTDNHLCLTSSWGTLAVDKQTGKVLHGRLCEYYPVTEDDKKANGDEWVPLTDYIRIDLDEWKKFYNVQEVPDFLDILDVGFWYKDKEMEQVEHYAAPDLHLRQFRRRIRSGEVSES